MRSSVATPPPRDRTILNDTLRADPEARRAYIRTMAFEAMLAREFAPPEESQAPAPARSKRWLALTAIAATIMLAATLAWHIQPGSGRAVNRRRHSDRCGRANSPTR